MASHFFLNIAIQFLHRLRNFVYEDEVDQVLAFRGRKLFERLQIGIAYSGNYIWKVLYAYYTSFRPYLYSITVMKLTKMFLVKD